MQDKSVPGTVATVAPSVQLRQGCAAVQQLRAQLRHLCKPTTQATQQPQPQQHNSHTGGGSGSRSGDGCGAMAAPHRSVDAATLQLLASPHYPFSLCEEAPPSYAPPAVPFDVEGEVNALKAEVCGVQAALEAHIAAHFVTSSPSSSSSLHERASKHTRPHATTTAARDSGGGAVRMPRRVTPRDVLHFLQQHSGFTALAARASSLQWLHRWVLTHSLSHLINAKEQLEYVLRDRQQAVPHDAAVLDAALRAVSFAEAVALLQQQRRDAVAEERRRLHSSSRTYRHRLPACAVTAAAAAAASRYLTREEAYLYQEVYNHTEHALMQLQQAHDVLRTAAAHDDDGNSGSNGSRRRHDGSSSAVRDGADGRCRYGDSVAHTEHDSHDDALRTVTHTSSSSRATARDVDALAAEALTAVRTEEEMLRMLLDVATQRRREREEDGDDDGGDDAAHAPDALQARYRCAQVAVYSCIVSDMSLMAYQISVAATFLEQYHAWLRYHGCLVHDTTATADVHVSLVPGTEGNDDEDKNSDTDKGRTDATHFAPPVAEMARYALA